MKFVRVTMPDKSEYDVPLQLLTEKLQDIKSQGSLFDVEMAVGASLMDDEELLKALGSGLNWKVHVAPYAVRVTKPEKVDLVHGWISGAKEIVEL